MFCRYCGRELQEGETCTCRNPQSQQPAVPQSPQPNQVQQEQQVSPQQPTFQQQVGAGVQSFTNAVQQSSVLQKLTELFLNMVKRPVATLESVYTEADKIPQYIFGGGYLLFTLLFSFTALVKTGILGGGLSFGIAFVLLLVTVVMKGAHMLAAYIFSDKRQGFSGICALFCASTLPETLLLVLLFLFMLIGWSLYLPILILASTLSVVNVAVNLLTFNTIFSNNRDKGYKVFLVLELIIAAFELVLLQAVVMVITITGLSLFGNLMSSFLW